MRNNLNHLQILGGFVKVPVFTTTGQMFALKAYVTCFSRIHKNTPSTQNGPVFAS
jgi:hypothetical protein